MDFRTLYPSTCIVVNRVVVAGRGKQLKPIEMASTNNSNTSGWKYLVDKSIDSSIMGGSHNYQCGVHMCRYPHTSWHAGYLDTWISTAQHSTCVSGGNVPFQEVMGNRQGVCLDCTVVEWVN